MSSCLSPNIAPKPKHPLNWVKKILFGTLLGLVAFFTSTFYPHPTNAFFHQGQVQQTVDDYIRDVLHCKDTTNYYLQCFVNNILDAIISESITQVGGTTNLALGPGLMNSTSSLIASLYQQQPASTAQYLAYLRHTYSAPQAYAQGAGYNALTPIQGVWGSFLNITYFFFVLIFVVAGFMIMFRTQINPQTVISLQNALPRLVVTLILVTFSFAIAGFLIDLMYFLTALAIKVLAASGMVNDAKANAIIFEQNLLGIWWNDIFGGFGALDPNATVQGSTATALAALIMRMFSITQSNVIGILVTGVSKILILFLSIVLVYTLFRVFFQLLMAFISIIVMVIFSPILLLFNALPGSSAFSNWLKNLFANILIFPAVAVFIVIAGALSGATNFGAKQLPLQSGSGFVPPLLGFQNIQVDSVQGLVGFGLLLMLPSVIQMIKDALKIEPFKYGKDITASLQTLLWYPRSLIQQAQQRKADLKQEQLLRNALSSTHG